MLLQRRQDNIAF